MDTTSEEYLEGVQESTSLGEVWDENRWDDREDNIPYEEFLVLLELHARKRRQFLKEEFNIE